MTTVSEYSLILHASERPSSESRGATTEEEAGSRPCFARRSPTNAATSQETPGTARRPRHGVPIRRAPLAANAGASAASEVPRAAPPNSEAAAQKLQVNGASKVTLEK